MATSSKRPEKNGEESATLPALTVEDDGVLHFCLERDSYDSGYCKTIKLGFLSADQWRVWMVQSQTNLCNKRPFPSEIVVYEHAQWSAAINTLMIVVSLSDSPCSARQRGKGVSERSELAPCIYIIYMYNF